MLNVVIQNVGEVTVLHLRGRIVRGVPIETRRKVVAAQGNARAVILDLARVDLIDAGGLGALLEMRMRAHSKGIEFKLMNVTPRVKDVLAITRLDSVFEFASQEDLQAIAGRDQESEMMVVN